jgi:hypothetical protein
MGLPGIVNACLSGETRCSIEVHNSPGHTLGREQAERLPQTARWTGKGRRPPGTFFSAVLRRSYLPQYSRAAGKTGLQRVATVGPSNTSATPFQTA